MSDRDHIRRLITLVENNDEIDSAKVLAEVADISKLLREAQVSWHKSVMLAWKDFFSEYTASRYIDQKEFSRLIRFVETRLARELGSLEQLLEEMQVKLNKLDKLIPPSFMYREQFVKFFNNIGKLAEGTKRSMGILEQEGYYHQSDLNLEFPRPWSYRDEVSEIYTDLIKMREICDDMKDVMRHDDDDDVF